MSRWPRWFRWLLLTVGAGLALVAVVLGIVWARTAPAPLAAGTESASRLAPGPWAVGTKEFDWVDESRATPPNGDFAGAPSRRLPTTMWYPKEDAVAHPLVVFCHGLMSTRDGGSHMARHLASHGYVVVAADHPLSNGRAPGGATYEDLPHQPGDQSFLIDRVLALGADAPFEGGIDTARIGVFGISLGGVTSTLTAFHPAWRDPRVAAAISLAGPADVFGPRFYDHASVPFLMIGSTMDAIVPYRDNAATVPERAATGGLLTLEGGTHAGYTHLTSGVMRILGNPDHLGCSVLTAGREEPAEQSVFVGLLGDAEQGLIVPPEHEAPCTTTYEGAMRPGRQQQIATVAVRAFFESVFASSAEERRANREFLEETLPREVEEVSFESSRRSSSVPARDASG